MTLAATANQTNQIINPLGQGPFFAIPRKVALLPNLSDAQYRFMSIMYSAFGDDGYIEFKIRTLARLMHKTERAVKFIIKKCRNAGLIITKQTGRSLLFFLPENPQIREVKNSPPEGKNISPPSHYIKEIKKSRPEPAPEPDPKPPEKAPAAAPFIPKKTIEKGIEKHGESYVKTLIEIAKSKKDQTAYIIAGINQKWESVMKKMKAKESQFVDYSKRIKELMKEQKKLDKELKKNKPLSKAELRAIRNKNMIDTHRINNR